jgi:hypothetical protein
MVKRELPGILVHVEGNFAVSKREFPVALVEFIY